MKPHTRCRGKADSAPGTVTTTTYVTGTAYVSTQTASGSVPGTVVQAFMATTVRTNATGPAATTSTVLQQGTTPGTVVVVYPTPATTCK